MVFRVIGRILGRFFRSIGRLLLGVFRTVSRHEAALGIVVVTALLIAGIVLLLNVLDINIVLGQPVAVTAPTTVATPTQVAATPTPVAIPQGQVSLNNAPSATESFLQGQIYFDAAKVWDSLDATYHTELQGQGEDQTYFEQFFQNLKSKGRQYLGYQFVGSYKGADKQQICFYIIRYRENNQTIEQPYTFWLNTEGKISKFS